MGLSRFILLCLLLQAFFLLASKFQFCLFILLMGILCLSSLSWPLPVFAEFCFTITKGNHIWICISWYQIQYHLLIWLLFFFPAGSQSFIGINYGLVADNLPPPAATAKLLQSTAIQKVRLYGADPAVLKALANTGIGIVIGASNGDIPALGSDPNSATQWVNSNVLPYYPASNIILITIGNEVISYFLHLQILYTDARFP